MGIVVPLGFRDEQYPGPAGGPLEAATTKIRGLDSVKDFLQSGVDIALSMIDPRGMGLSSKRINPRWIDPSAVRPAKKDSPAPLLRSPAALS